MKYDPDVLDPRLAGGVLRYHAYPHIKPQSIAEHMWHVTRILLAICPEASRDMIIESMFHDIGEMVSGDSPFYAKRAVPDLKQVLDKIENQARLAMSIPWGVVPHKEFTIEERTIMKLADLLEMLEYALYEVELGNVCAYRIVSNLEDAFTQISIPISIEKEFSRYKRNRMAIHGRRMQNGYGKSNGEFQTSGRESLQECERVRTLGLGD